MRRWLALQRSARDIVRFVALTYALAVPFYVVGAVSDWQIVPGLPIAALMFVGPTMAALLLVGTGARRALLARALDDVRPRAWLAPVLLLMPAILAISYAWQRAHDHAPALVAVAPWLPPVLFGAFFVAALGEEIGWTGYATERSRANVGAGLFLGVACAGIHVIPFAQAHRDVEWIVWQCLFTIAFRVILVMLFSRAGRSVLAVSLCHAAYNTAWLLLPVGGSSYDPRSVFAITAVVAVALGFARPQQ